MNVIKKLSIMLFAIAMCVMLGVTAWAATGDDVSESDADFSASLTSNTICVNAEASTVTVTVSAKEDVSIFSLYAVVVVPNEEWSVASVTSSDLGAAATVNYGENGRVIWYHTANVSTETLLVITYNVPADATGTFELGIEDLELYKISDTENAKGYDKITEGTSATTTLTIKEHDYSHKVDYEWNADYTQCTATGTCACGANDTVTVGATSVVKTPATCTVKGTTTYTSNSFGVYWANTQTKNVQNIAIDVTKHAYPETPSSYTNNGDGTHTANYVCGNNTEHTKSDEAEDHDFTNGNCVCGAEKPATPAGLKGDIDLDGDVDIDDFAALARHIGEVDVITDVTALSNADVASDGVVDINDFAKLAQYIGEIITDLN